MITRKCNNILIDGDQEVLMGKKVLVKVLAKTLNLNLGHLQVNEKFYLC